MSQQAAAGPGRAFWVVALPSAGVILIFAGLFAASASSQHLAAFSVVVLTMAASLAVGGLVGFLFGIPRSLQDPAASTRTPPGSEDQVPSYAVNTNLEQISDWLTKILVGIGLVEIGRAPSAIGRLIDSLGTDLGGEPIDRLMAGAVLILFPIIGFLVSYLLTRLLLRRAFTMADMSVVGAVAAQAAISEVRQQEQRDALGYSLVANQLEPPPGTAPPGQQRLDSALTRASPSLRSQVFSLVRDRRAAHWLDANKKTMMGTIAVFCALIAADPDSHRNHGQLGYALKDSQPPDLDGAERELNRAIALRDSQGEAGWLYYELNRAALRIKRDLGKLAAQQPPEPDTCAAILDDLKAAAVNEHLRKIIYDDTEIQQWIRDRAPERTDLLAQSSPPGQVG